MAADHFFKRWARPKIDVSEQPPVVSPAAESRLPAPPPTLTDITSLTANSDYSRFFAAGVDKAVQRAALKKLFSDPHFNLIDGLDIYIGDYNKASPIPPAMLAALNHVQDLLAPAQSEPEPIAPDMPPSAAEDAAGVRKDDS